MHGDIALNPVFGGGTITQQQARRAKELSTNAANGRRAGESNADYFKRLITWAKNNLGMSQKQKDELIKKFCKAAAKGPEMSAAAGWRPDMTPEEEEQWEREQEQGAEELLHATKDVLEEATRAGEVPPEAVP